MGGIKFCVIMDGEALFIYPAYRRIYWTKDVVPYINLNFCTCLTCENIRDSVDFSVMPENIKMANKMVGPYREFLLLSGELKREAVEKRILIRLTEGRQL